jgi:hypothetical protein
MPDPKIPIFIVLRFTFFAQRPGVFRKPARRSDEAAKTGPERGLPDPDQENGWDGLIVQQGNGRSAFLLD